MSDDAVVSNVVSPTPGGAVVSCRTVTSWSSGDAVVVVESGCSDMADEVSVSRFASESARVRFVDGSPGWGAVAAGVGSGVALFLGVFCGLYLIKLVDHADVSGMVLVALALGFMGSMVLSMGLYYLVDVVKPHPLSVVSVDTGGLVASDVAAVLGSGTEAADRLGSELVSLAASGGSAGHLLADTEQNDPALGVSGGDSADSGAGVSGVAGMVADGVDPYMESVSDVVIGGPVVDSGPDPDKAGS